MSEYTEYSSAVAAIKTAILQSQYDAAKAANETQLMLYFGIGKYISHNSRKGFWGKGAINAISERLNKELPGLRGFSARNLRNMRTFYEEWAVLDTTSDNLALANAKTDVDNLADASAKTDVDNLADASAKLEIYDPAAIWQTRLPNSDTFPYDEFLLSFKHFNRDHS